ncbi:unnamed protein product [Acanthoscelides obtectus]|uniref:Uncharacterized protein n=1 Tax=Acanthoscelides obtectus TaxID=200917 RepID=A0A9P0JSV1_ACAOB|nr:unnamed protein product [Acanthoscelides obtectus]CAK1633878.1 hypothetical protein AOBTE_LOCUS8455 [Acanthoscelides obtectus]
MGIFTRKKQYLHKALPEGISNTSTPASQDGCGSVDELCSSTHLVSPTSNQMVPLPVSTSSYISKPWSKTALGPLLSKATSSVRSQSLSKTPSKPLKYQVRSMTRADDRSEILETIVDNVEYPEIEEGTKDTDLEECSKNADLGGSSTDADVVPPFYKTVAETPKPKASNNKPVPSTAPKPLPYCKPQLKPCCKRMPQKPAQKHARSNIPPVPVKSSRSVNSTISRSGYPAKSSRSGSMALPARSLKTPNGGNPAAVFCCGAEAFSNCPPRRVEFQGYHRPELQDVGVSASLRLVSDPGDPVLAESTASLHSATIKSHHSQRSNAGKSGTSLANDHDVGDESYEDYENEDQLEYKPSPTCQVQCCCASCCPPPDTCNFFRMPPLPPCQYAAQQYSCQGAPPCMTQPNPTCKNQQFSQGKHLEEKWEKKEKTETKVCYCTTYQSAYGTKARCGPCCTVQFPVSRLVVQLLLAVDVEAVAEE